MSSQPGRIIREIEVEMPRPRKMEDIRENPEMAGQFVEIWQHLQEEVQRSRREEE